MNAVERLSRFFPTRIGCEILCYLWQRLESQCRSLPAHACSVTSLCRCCRWIALRGKKPCYKTSEPGNNAGGPFRWWNSVLSNIRDHLFFQINWLYIQGYIHEQLLCSTWGEVSRNSREGDGTRQLLWCRLAPNPQQPSAVATLHKSRGILPKVLIIHPV
jgi:hypothetical protein